MGTINDNSDRVTEWKLKSSMGKSMFILRHILSVVFYYGFGAAIVGAILLGKGLVASMSGFFAVVGCSLALGLFLFWTRLDRAIKESDERMGDANYIAKLRQLGFFR